MKKYLSASLAAITLSAGSTVALGQFSSDPASLPAVSDAAGDQTLSKIAMLADGSFYVSWNDAATGYDVYLQRYNAAGVEQWAHNGVLVGDRAFAGISGDYELRADAAGNAYLAFPQDNGNTRLVKMTPAGTPAWSSIVSPDTTSKIGARMALLSDGAIAVGWLEGASFRIRRVGADGTPMAGTLTVSETGHNPSLCDLQPGDAGSVIALWVRPFSNSFGASRYLRAQKYDQNLSPLWPDAAVGPGMSIYEPVQGTPLPLGGGTYTNAQGGSIQNGYFPYFQPDGAGGAVFCWYENSMTRTAFVQQVSAAGVKRWDTPYGRPLTDANTGPKISASADYDRTTGEIYASWIETNGTQNQWGTSAQKVAADGTLAWGATGSVVAPLDTNQEAFVNTVRRPQGGCYVIGFEGRPSISTSGVAQAALLNAAGAPAWTPVVHEVCSDTSAKGRLWTAGTPTGGAVMTFSNGSGGNADLLLGNIRADDTQGVCAADLGGVGGLAGPDGLLNNNDFVVFIDFFFAANPLADFGSTGGIPGQDGAFDNNDFVVFIDEFFAGCD
ncbi:MAG TPA: GC-type dockerin domain-anchored protein [Phycisphaerales bacterium]|nr:GC-type dockerin domain-anchored protein [Phycisphaerales bacterium]